MRVPRADWSRWLVAGGIALAVFILVLALFRAPVVVGDGAASRPPPEVSVAPSTDPLLTEEAMLRDPTPLFLPTRWNATENALPAAARPQLGSGFRDFQPAWAFAGPELKLHLPPAVAVPGSATEAVTAERAERPLIGLGQTDRTVQPLPPRGAFVRVSSQADGQVVLARAVEVRPPAETAWQPLEFLVAVDPVGLVRPAVLTQSSQTPGIDAFFQDYLQRGFRLGERLPPGFYRVSIGP